MKRTRRIEITRYRRTVTVITSGDKLVAYPKDEVTLLETAANEWEVRPEGNDLECDRLVKRTPPTEVKARRSPLNFRKWLRRKG